MSGQREPAWATILIDAVMRREGGPRPDIYWATRSRGGASGTTYHGGGPAGEDIRIRAASSVYRDVTVRPWDSVDRRATDMAALAWARAVLLHELAHFLTPRANHSARFWRKCWELYDEYLTDVELTIAARMEREYRQRSVRVAPERALRLLAESDGRRRKAHV